MFRNISLLLTAALLSGCSLLPSSPPPPTLPPQPTLSSSTETAPPSVPSPTFDLYIDFRRAMVNSQIEARGVQDKNVLDAMKSVPRHQFVTDQYLNQAYEDHPLPIGYGQTISQPYIVALMTEALQLEPGDKVLEIGTGSGYQAAVLAAMDTEVYTMEIIPELAQRARANLASAGYKDVEIKNADGYFGWEEHAPFDAIIVTAAPDHMPQPLSNQLKEGGRMVIPIGPIGAVQTLWLFEKQNGELEATNLGSVRFVPFTRGES